MRPCENTTRTGLQPVAAAHGQRRLLWPLLVLALYVSTHGIFENCLKVPTFRPSNLAHTLKQLQLCQQGKFPSWPDHSLPLLNIYLSYFESRQFGKRCQDTS